MTTSLSNHGPSARPVDGFDEIPDDQDNPYEARMRGLSHHSSPTGWRGWLGTSPVSSRR